MNLNIRNEREADFFAVENLVREAFWNVYQPGCDEHMVTHHIRTLPCFIPALDFIAEREGEIIGNIIYSKVKVTSPDGAVYPFAAFGPLAVHPAFQKQGVGSTLIRHSLKAAEEEGIPAVFITGSPDYYQRFGFVSASAYGVRLKGVPQEEEAPFFMVKLLKKDALDAVAGVLEFDECYIVDSRDLEEFEKRFPPKVKEKHPGQLV